jgi:hypothetical protein
MELCVHGSPANGEGATSVIARRNDEAMTDVFTGRKTMEFTYIVNRI